MPRSIAAPLCPRSLEPTGSRQAPTHTAVCLVPLEVLEEQADPSCQSYLWQGITVALRRFLAL